MTLTSLVEVMNKHQWQWMHLMWYFMMAYSHLTFSCTHISTCLIYFYSSRQFSTFLRMTLLLREQVWPCRVWPWVTHDQTRVSVDKLAALDVNCVTFCTQRRYSHQSVFPCLGWEYQFSACCLWRNCYFWSLLYHCWKGHRIICLRERFN